ncbi:hypothetical protein [Pseudoflavitalea rhizosphaerae]|uniref:hypothetical protein n=1 Tax=Pseudoflavitalea rhizosphaerae TaxID=1884793 RepID=UPI000F8DF9B0|nr:hypothetical protein [Pseudoflavitalea rhizosphaerae]
MTSIQPTPGSGNTRVLRGLFTVMAIAYLAACFTPLHIHFDSIRYYNIKDCLEYGCPPDSFAATDYLPYGYTALLIGLSKLGILNGFFIVLVNCIYLFFGIWFVQKIFKEQLSPFLFYSLVLFNWTVIKFSTHPLSEMQYIFFSCSSLYCFHLYTKQKGYKWLILAFLLGFLTLLTRTVGISLIPALVLGVVYQHRAEISRIIRKNKLVIVAIIVVLAILAFFAKQLKIMDYTSLLKTSMGKGAGSFFAENLKNHLQELGEVFVNMPASKLMGFLPGATGPVLFVILGVAVLVWFLWILFAKRSSIPFYIKMYLVFYAFIIINWPYYDPRFWVPVLPLIIAVVMQTPFNSRPWLKLLSKAYLVFYLVLGIIAAIYSLKTGLNKEEFAKKQANGVYRNEYETHFFGKPLSDTAVHLDQNVVDILNKYDK